MSDLLPPDRDDQIQYVDGSYQSEAQPPSWIGRTFPTMHFYQQFVRNVLRSSRIAQRGKYDNEMWSRTSFEVLRALESVGIRVEVSGTQNLRSLQSPCVFVGNHMSMLETIVLPAIIQPICDVTFVVKQSLVDYPVFRHILRSRNPIAVSRVNAREDFKAVITQGAERLKQGISVVVFPQTTRSTAFDPSQFNSIGIKLASRCGVPVVPIALRTDAWGNGKRLKDLGPIDPTKTVHFEFGSPIHVEGRGEAQHQQVVQFIESRLASWAK